MTPILTILTTALLDGPFETPLWSSFLEGLRVAVRADYATLICQAPSGNIDEALYLIAGDATVDEAMANFRRFGYPDNPARRNLADEGRLYTLAEIRDRELDLNPAFFSELAGTIGLTAARQMRIQEPSGIDAWLSVVRRGGDFSRAECNLLTDLAPILRGVLRNYVAREKDRFAAQMGSDAARRLQFGWIALDGAGLVLDTDPFGEQVLATSEVLSRDHRGLLAVRPRERQGEVELAVAQLAAESHRRPRAFRLRGDPWLDMLLVPARHRRLTAAGAVAVIAYVHGDNWASIDRQSQLAELFSLKPGESKLALALCRGKSIAEAAEEIGLTVESARTYSKSIFAKTGAKGQPDLVRIIMGSILALAPDG
jgi:DNA-binding CsgD family transcriptional regulator